MKTMQTMIRALAVLGTCSMCLAGCATAPDEDPAVSSTEDNLSISQWSINAQVPSMFSAQSPALAALNGVAYLNHSGSGDSGIWWAKYTPSTWTHDATVGNQASTATPSLAAFNGFVYMTHLSSNSGATQVWYSRFDPATQTWRPDSQLPYQSAGTPTIQAFGSRLYIIGVTPGTSQLWWATMDATEGFTASSLLPFMFSATPPSLAVLNNRLYMVHRAGVTTSMVLNSFDGTSWGPDLTIDGGFNGGPQTNSDQPAIAAYGGVLHLVHNETSAGGIWWSYYTPSTGVWSAEVAFPANQRMTGFAALAPLPTQLLMVHHGSGDNTLWYSVFQ